MADLIQIRRATAAVAAANNVILADGEMGYETDTKKKKIGDGVTPYNGLIYDGDMAVIEATGTLISFTTSTIYNTATAPATGNLTTDLTGAKVGIVQKIYHNHTVAPTPPAGWVLIGGAYVTGVVNLIYAEWAKGTRIEYWITQDQI